VQRLAAGLRVGKLFSIDCRLACRNSLVAGNRLYLGSSNGLSLCRQAALKLLCLLMQTIPYMQLTCVVYPFCCCCHWRLLCCCPSAALLPHRQRVLSAYAGELLKRLPKTATGGTSAQPPYHGSDWHVRLPQEEEEVLAAILATAEYCR
jgi:hypothetical protein